MDLNSDARARVVALFSGAAQTISIDDSGNEPDITLPKTEENVAGHLLGEGRGGLLISKRRNLLGCLKRSLETGTSCTYQGFFYYVAASAHY
mmetsp:Transcript_32136/g.77704  ORF Transcript_32136/g.77704 Transcript_32136/m.77704 type:complete len:92 (-) Transcript_32136:47-322(-)